MQRYLQLVPLLFLTLFFTACGDLEGAGNVDQPERPPEGAFGVSETFDGPYLGLDGAISDPADEQILEVEPGGKFYARAVYESLTGITDITVSLINPNPEGLAGPLDPTRSFFTLGEPTSISEPGGDCELTGEDAQVTCIYEIQVAEDAVNIDELEGAADEFAYIFSPQATNAAGATSDEDLRGYVRVIGGTAEKPEPEPETCADPVAIPDKVLESVIRISLNIDISTRPLTCEDLGSLTELVNVGENLAGLSNLEGLQFASNLERIVLKVDDDREEATSIGDLSPLANLTELREINVETEGETIEDINPLRDLVNLEVIALGGNKIEDIGALANLTELRSVSLNNSGISDLSPLRSLTNLETLVLANNPFSDLSPLANLTNLETIFFTENEIRDLSPLRNLTNLTSLTLGDNSADNNLVSDLSPLEGLTNLINLDLGGNLVSDLSPLEGLTNLEDLGLSHNQIVDISALVANEGLGPQREGQRGSDNINLRGNPLDVCPGSEARQNVDTLTERGVRVLFDEPESCDAN